MLCASARRANFGEAKLAKLAPPRRDAVAPVNRIVPDLRATMRRAAACGIKPGKIMKLALYFCALRRIEGIHPLQGGLVRRKYRRDRRPGLPIESPMVFYPRYLWKTITKSLRLFALLRCYKRILARVNITSAKYAYLDVALTQATKEDLHTLEIFKATEGAGYRL